MGLTTGEGLIHLLKSYDVDTVFGMPGVHTLDFYRALPETGIRHVGVRHEQGAGFMADGYARVSGKPGVCLLISGPGITNAATPIGQAYSDSQPMLILSSVGSVGDIRMGRGTLHEIHDQRATTAPITAFSEIAYTPRQAEELIHRAFALFASSRPRPCHVSVPLDVLSAPWDGDARSRRTPRRSIPDPADVAAAAKLIASTGPAVIIVGGGAVDASQEIRLLAERIGAAVIPTVAGKGILPEDHPLSLEMTLDRPGTHAFLRDAGLVLAIGTEFAEPDYWLEDRLETTGKLIRIDIDAATLARDYATDVSILGDARAAVQGINNDLEGLNLVPGFDEATLTEARKAGRSQFGSLEDVHGHLIAAIREAMPPDAYCFTDMTQIAYSAYTMFPANMPRQWFFPVGYGTLGFALPAAIGAWFSAPERPGCVLVGDGGFQFTLQELATAVEWNMPLPVILWDNSSLKQIALYMREQDISEISVHPHNPDFIKLAEAYGMEISQPQSLSELVGSIRDAWTRNRPTLIRVCEFDDWVQNSR